MPISGKWKHKSSINIGFIVFNGGVTTFFAKSIVKELHQKCLKFHSRESMMATWPRWLSELSLPLTMKYARCVHNLHGKQDVKVVFDGYNYLDSKVYGANMGFILGQQEPDWLHVVKHQCNRPEEHQRKSLKASRWIKICPLQQAT